MARIRTIKPEFWGDEKLSPLPPLDRLVFLGLISMADDAGRVVDSLRTIDGFIFPSTDDTSRDSLEVLAELGRIDRGVTASGQRVIQLINWKHQKIDKPNFASALPPILILDESCRRRRMVPAKLRDAIYDRDKGVCQECGRDVRRNKRDKYDAGPDLAEIDHIVAVKDGGTNDPENLRLLCLACNRKKAGIAVRERNADASANVRGSVDDVSTLHINDLLPVPTINDQVSAISDRADAADGGSTTSADVETPESPRLAGTAPADNSSGEEGRGARADEASTVSRARPIPEGVSRDQVLAYTRALAKAANEGITYRWGEQPLALKATTGLNLAVDLIAAAMPIELATMAIVSVCHESRLPRPMSTLEYFRGAIEDAARGGKPATAGAMAQTPGELTYAAGVAALEDL